MWFHGLLCDWRCRWRTCALEWVASVCMGQGGGWSRGYSLSHPLRSQRDGIVVRARPNVSPVAGFIAGHCIHQLLEKGYNVRGTVRYVVHPAQESLLRCRVCARSGIHVHVGVCRCCLSVLPCAALCCAVLCCV